MSKIMNVVAEIQCIENHTSAAETPYRVVHAIDEKDGYGRLFCWNGRVKMESDKTYKLMIRVKDTSRGKFAHVIGAEEITEDAVEA